MQESHYWDLIKKHLEAKASKDEEEELDRWMKLSDDNRKSYEVQRELWKSTEFLPIDFKTENAWINVKSKLTDQKEGRVISFNIILKIAASILIILVAGVLLRSEFFSTKILSVAAPYNNTLKIVLPDKSVVWLNKNSTLQYPKVFDGKERNVSLTGEAFFEVQKDENRPFKVSTEGAITEVLGTSFNVDATNGGNAVSVSVLTGKVAFYFEKTMKDRVVLLPGNTGVFDKGSKRVFKIKSKDTNLLAWKTGILKFENTSMHNVVMALEEQYSKQIIIENKELLDCRVTSQFANVSLEKLLSELQFMLNFNYTIQDQKVLITGGSCH